MSSAQAVLEQIVKSFNARDEAATRPLVSPDVVLTAPGGLDYRGHAGWHQWFQLWDQACPDKVISYHNVIGDGDQAIGEGTFTGTHTGVLSLPTGEVPATGRKLKADFVAVIRVKDGKMTYLRHYFDVMDLMAQLGLVGAPAAA